VFSISIPVPGRVGDDVWRQYDDMTEDVAEWVRWGISVPLLETYETRAQTSRANDKGIIELPSPH
jgi:hypothetical protein